MAATKLASSPWPPKPAHTSGRESSGPLRDLVGIDDREVSLLLKRRHYLPDGLTDVLQMLVLVVALDTSLDDRLLGQNRKPGPEGTLLGTVQALVVWTEKHQQEIATARAEFDARAAVSP
ncbi:hypothetical protein [Nocardioides speluncae]|uniref:hypothetical protein n=1 Tax=Nocardioides speluncae TaxID=2670337 RepID=UPI0012B16BF9|nr:hypothetical protein [Nocardioides speluncae]